MDLKMPEECDTAYPHRKETGNRTDGFGCTVRVPSGHLLIDECLALLFVVYIDPAFGVYLLERVDELLSGGFTVSDTWLVQAAGLRFTKEELTQILEQHETQHI